MDWMDRQDDVNVLCIHKHKHPTPRRAARGDIPPSGTKNKRTCIYLPWHGHLDVLDLDALPARPLEADFHQPNPRRLHYRLHGGDALDARARRLPAGGALAGDATPWVAYYAGINSSMRGEARDAEDKNGGLKRGSTAVRTAVRERNFREGWRRGERGVCVLHENATGYSLDCCRPRIPSSGGAGARHVFPGLGDIDM